MVVCHCEAVNDERIRAEVRSGASSQAEVAMACRAGTGCGGCLPVIDDLIDDEQGRLVHLRSVAVA